jgi:tetratricopeptide (TPR) repeat protein
MLLMNDAARARPFADRALQVAEDQAKSDARNVDSILQLAAAYYGEALVSRDRPAESLAYSDRAIATFRSAMQQRTGGPSPPVLRATLRVRVDALTALGQFAKAIETAEQELEITGALLKTSPDNAAAQRSQAVAWAQIGKIHAARREWKDAREYYRRASDAFHRLKHAGKLIPIAEKELAEAEEGLARSESAPTGGTR